MLGGEDGGLGGGDRFGVNEEEVRKIGRLKKEGTANGQREGLVRSVSSLRIVCVWF